MMRRNIRVKDLNNKQILNLGSIVAWILFSLYSFILVRLWNKQLFAYVNHARIRSKPTSTKQWE